MIQRIQTVYLLIVVALNLAVVFLPLAVIQSGGAFYSFDASGMSTIEAPQELVYPTWALMALSAIISLLALVTVFLYKKRILQIRLCIFNALLIIGFYGLFAFSLWKVAGASESFHFSMRIAVAFPLVSLILNYLAIREIGADEALIRSLDRLR
ncbi:DUF4293 domain-containing protein [Tannerella sp.]|uniref:DUF4293 domain-containing protein n=1 Tax=Tannerella sp. TaxID=2382127 RepID=UPI0026DCAB5E|nr:DUF4293 domain-containing protein [Tannerella sp.]MDO4703169.1 DUF4293 domain-containing protein [Tannerella sp.]